jgi:hypothetical protein
VREYVCVHGMGRQYAIRLSPGAWVSALKLTIGRVVGGGLSPAVVAAEQSQVALPHLVENPLELEQVRHRSVLVRRA